jgi:ABC-type uncharacterized transport system substrate-binding protein
MMDRRAFLGTFVLLAAPLAVEAQQAGKVYRIGFLRSGHPPENYIAGLQQGLREEGYVPGQDVVIELRATDGSVDQLPRLAEELVHSRVDVVVASAAFAALAVKRTTVSVPVVFVGIVNPVEIGLVSSLARPGGNITGLGTNSADLAGKRLEMLRAIVPRLRRVAVLSHPANSTNPTQLKGAQDAARTLGVQLELVSIQGPGDFDAPAKTVRGADGLLSLESPLFITYRARIAELAARSRLPAVFSQREYVEAGGLMSYGTDFRELYRRGGRYVGKILKGAKPADLPIEQASKFDLAINLKTAKALGLTIPPSLLQRADQVIE